MKKLNDILESRISQAIHTVTEQDCPALVKVSADAKFGDYQANGVMAAAKKAKTNPRQLAEQIVTALDVADICQPPEIAGPGFINLRIKDEFLAEHLLEMNADKDRLAIEKTETPKTIVVDYSGPNIAKQMHVGHLRSTIIGDCISRMYEFEGHTVIRQNHIGDWGTQFGKVILGLWHLCMATEIHKEPYYKDELEHINRNKDNRDELYQICLNIRNRHENDYLEDQEKEFGDANITFGPFLQRLPEIAKKIWPDILASYQYVNVLDDILVGMNFSISSRKIVNNEVEQIQIPYENLSRYITVMLQRSNPKHDKQERDAWNAVKEITMQHCNKIYKRLNVTLKHPRDTRGESFYKNMLSDVVETLKQKQLAVESDGAICVFPEGFQNKEGNWLPFIIQKTDGASLYATTDLAAVRYRIEGIEYCNKIYHTEKIIYVTDARQSQHFQMLFAVVKMAGWERGRLARNNIELEHVTFGSILGENGKPLKTRSGENVKLEELLDKAEQQAQSVVEAKNPDLPAEQKNEIAKAVGIGAVKYADYSNNRNSDFIFSFDKMLAMEGNTAPLYAIRLRPHPVDCAQR